MLCKTFLDFQLEWKMINNFRVRVRSLGFPEIKSRLDSIPPEMLKFDINLYKDGD